MDADTRTTEEIAAQNWVKLEQLKDLIALGNKQSIEIRKGVEELQELVDKLKRKKDGTEPE